MVAVLCCEEGRGETPPAAIASAVAACLPPSQCSGMAASRWETASPVQEETAVMLPLQ